MEYVMDGTVLFFLCVISAGVGLWANSWGRNGWGWGIAAFFLSPLLIATALLISGKTLEAKAQEAAILNAKIDELTNR